MNILDINIDDPVKIRWAIFAFATACYLIFLYSIWRQYSLYKRTKEVPIEYVELESSEKYKKDRLISLDWLRFEIFSSTFRWLELIPFLFFGFTSFLWSISKNWCHFFGFQNEYFYSIMFVWIAYTFSMPEMFLGRIFNAIYIQRKYYKESDGGKENGISEEKKSKCICVLKHLGKKFLVYAFGIPFGTASFLAIVRLFGPENFWLAIFILLNIFIFAGIFFMDYLVIYILPSYRQLPIHECELRRNIEKMCAQENVEISGIFLSKKGHSLVCSFEGYWSSRKKVVLDEIPLEERFVKEVYAFNGKNYEEENGIETMENVKGNNGEGEKEGEEAGGEGGNDGNQNEGEKMKADDDAPNAPLMASGEEKKIAVPAGKDVDASEEEEEFELNEDDVLAMVAAEIGILKWNETIRQRITHRIHSSGCLQLLPLLVFQCTYQSEWLFSAFNFPPSEHFPPIIGLFLNFQLFVFPVFQIVNGFLTQRRELFFAHFAAKSALRLGHGKQYRAALVKLFVATSFELGDWLYCLLHFENQWEMMPTELDAISKMLAESEREMQGI